MIQFGGRILPVHFVGGLVEGALPAGGLNLNYKAGLGNGRGSVISRGGDAGDVNGHRAWLAERLHQAGQALRRCRSGGAYYDDRVTLASGAEFDEQIIAAHCACGTRKRRRSSPSTRACAIGIAPPGRLAGRRRSTSRWRTGCRSTTALWKPYFRFEHIDVDRADLMFAGVPSLDDSTLGVR